MNQKARNMLHIFSRRVLFATFVISVSIRIGTMCSDTHLQFVEVFTLLLMLLFPRLSFSVTLLLTHSSTHSLLSSMAHSHRHSLLAHVQPSPLQALTAEAAPRSRNTPRPARVAPSPQFPQLPRRPKISWRRNGFST